MGGVIFIQWEPELPEATSQEDWEAIVKAYEILLNTQGGLDARIDLARLSLDTTANVMNLILPQKTVSLQHETVERLLSYSQTKDPQNLNPYKYSFPATERSQSAPQGFANNDPKTLCHINALLQMILSYPFLRAQLEIPEKISPRDLERALYPGEPPRQQDILETLKKLHEHWKGKSGDLPLFHITEPWEDHTTPLLTDIPDAASYQTLIFHADRVVEKQPQKKNTGLIDLTERFSTTGKDSSYQLRSFAVHTSSERQDGSTRANEGHYIAYVKIKGLDGKTHYYKTDDAYVVEVRRKEFLELGKNFSLAFYDRLEK